MDMEQRDYDSRTALHVAAAEGYKLPFVLRVQVCVLVSHADMRVCVCVFCCAAAGHAEVVRFLLEACKVNPVPKDR